MAGGADLYSVALTLDASGLATGARAAETALSGVGTTALKTETSIKQLHHSMESIKETVMEVAPFLAVGEAIHKIVEWSSESQNSFAQLQAVIKSTGGVAKLTAEELSEMAEGLAHTSTFSHDSVMAMQSVLLTFDRMGGAVVPRASAAILDFSTRMGIDLTTAARMVGKALDMPAEGLTALGRAGVKFDESQKAMLQSLVDSGNAAKAQAIILGELETKFGGAAAAARDTLGGAIAHLGNVFKEQFEFSKEQTSLLADALNLLAENIHTVVAAGEALAAVMAARWISGALQGLIAYNTELRATAAANIAQLETTRASAANEVYLAEVRLAAAQTKLRANTLLGASEADLAILTNNVTAAETRLAVATGEAALAQKALATATTLTGQAMAGLNKAMTALGGPIGIAILAGTALSMLLDHITSKELEAAEAADEASKKQAEAALEAKHAREQHTKAVVEANLEMSKFTKIASDNHAMMAALTAGGMRAYEQKKLEIDVLAKASEEWDKQKEALKGTAAYTMTYSQALQAHIPLAQKLHAAARDNVTSETALKDALDAAKKADEDAKKVKEESARVLTETVPKLRASREAMESEQQAILAGGTALDNWRVKKAVALALAEKGTQLSSAARAALIAETEATERAAIALDHFKTSYKAAQDVQKTVSEMQREINDIQREIEAVNQSKAAHDELRVVLAGEAAGRDALEKGIDLTTQAGLLEYATVVALAQARARATNELRNAEQAAEDASKSGTKLITDMRRELASQLENFFVNVVNKGKNAFTELWNNILAAFEKMVAQMVAQDLITRLKGSFGAILSGTALTPALAGAQNKTPPPTPTPTPAPLTTADKLMSGLGVGMIGYGIGSTIGSMTTNTTLGALGGAASGAAAGALAGSVIPGLGTLVGGIIGGVAGFVGGLLSSGEAARKHAEAINQAAQQLQQNITAFTNTNDSLTAKADAIRKQSQDIQKAIDDLYNQGYYGKGATAAANANAQTQSVRDAEARRLADLRKAVMDGLDKDVRTTFGTKWQNAVFDLGDWLNQRLKALGELVDAGLLSPEARDAAEKQVFAVWQKRVDDIGAQQQYEEHSQMAGLQARINQGGRGASDTAARQAQAVAFEKELLDARMANASPELIAMIKAAQAADQQALEKSIADRKRVAALDVQTQLLTLQGKTAEAEKLKLLEAQRQRYEQAVRDGLDEETMAALKLLDAAEQASLAAQQAESAFQRMKNDLSVQYQVFGTSVGEQAQNMAKMYGFEGKTRDDLLAMFNKVQIGGPELTQAQRDMNNHILEYIQLLDKAAQATATAAAGASSAASAAEDVVNGASYSGTTGVSGSVSIGASGSELVTIGNVQTTLLQQINDGIRQLVQGGGAGGMSDVMAADWSTASVPDSARALDTALGVRKAVVRIGLGTPRS